MTICNAHSHHQRRVVRASDTGELSSRQGDTGRSCVMPFDCWSGLLLEFRRQNNLAFLDLSHSAWSVPQECQQANRSSIVMAGMMNSVVISLLHHWKCHIKKIHLTPPESSEMALKLKIPLCQLFWAKNAPENWALNSNNLPLNLNCA